MKLILAVLLLLLTMPRLGMGQQKGAIRGVVVDAGGDPFPSARVFADPVGGWRMHWVRNYVSTDDSGRFAIDGLEPGKYGVFAMKEDALYPDLSSSFYSDNTFPTAVITSSSPTAEVRIQLRPKAGILTGAVIDAETGKPLAAGIELRRTKSPDEWLSSSIAPNYRVLLPSSVDVSVAFVESGYKRWTFQGPLNLQPGEELRLDVSLEPNHDPALQACQFLIPDRYAGWLLLMYGQKDAQPSLTSEGTKVFKFPQSGILKTSSSGPERGADRKYLYYSPDGSLHDVPMDYNNGGGMIWGEYDGTRNGIMSEFGFFVGTEEQYEKAKNHRPIQ